MGKSKAVIRAEEKEAEALKKAKDFVNQEYSKAKLKPAEKELLTKIEYARLSSEVQSIFSDLYSVSVALNIRYLSRIKENDSALKKMRDKNYMQANQVGDTLRSDVHNRR